MEKLPFGDRPEPRIVGGGPSEAKEDTRKTILDRFGKGHQDQFSKEQREQLEAEEREKTEEEKEDIRIANKLTNELLREFGLKEFDVPAENVHFISRKMWDARFEREADVPSMVTNPMRQAVFVRGDYDSKARVHNALSMFHEFVHLKGHLSFEVESEKARDIHRSGLMTNATYKKMDRVGFGQWFDGLNEAVVTEMEVRSADRVLRENSFLKDEVEWLDSPEAKDLKEKCAKKHDIDPSEIEWISRDGEEQSFQSYWKQRKVLNYVVDQIYAEGGFGSRDEVMKLFFEAHFKNSLLPIGRLVEKTFGEGAFRELGGMDKVHASVSAGRVMDALMKRRRIRKSGSRNKD